MSKANQMVKSPVYVVMTIVSVVLLTGATSRASAMPTPNMLTEPNVAPQPVAYRHTRRAGLYNCRAGSLHTRLERQACGANYMRYHRRYR